MRGALCVVAVNTASWQLQRCSALRQQGAHHGVFLVDDGVSLDNGQVHLLTDRDHLKDQTSRAGEQPKHMLSFLPGLEACVILPLQYRTNC